MSITLYTGLPGSFKTSHLVRDLLHAVKTSGRPVYACGIDGLDPALGVHPFEADQWNDPLHDGDCACTCTASDRVHRHVIPDGSILFIDEAWKWFGHLSAPSRGATPQHVLQLAEHRHRGIDMVWTAQSPVQIYPFARGLIDRHIHLVRRFGTNFVDAFEWPQLCESISARSLSQAIRSTRAAPTDGHQHYKSASIHTIKRRIPLRVIAIPLLFAAALFLAIVAYRYLHNRAQPAVATTSINDAAPPMDASRIPSASEATAGIRTAADYTRMYTPLIAAIPWSAPAYITRPAVSQPTVACMSSTAGLDANGHESPGSCHCITDQGTTYALDDTTCRSVARNPPYNPQLEPVAPAQPSQTPQGPGLSTTRNLTTGPDGPPAALAATAPGADSAAPAANLITQ